MKNRNSRIKERLVKVSEQLWYELQMLRGTSSLMENAQFQTNNQVSAFAVPSAVVESFEFHARNLIEFFYPKNLKETHIIEDDFFVDLDVWKRNRPMRTQKCENAQ